MGFGKDGKGVIIYEGQSQALTTLAAGSVIKIGTPLAITEDFRMIKSEILATLEGLTANEGPFDFGLADNELSTAEIQATLDTDGPLDSNDYAAKETAERPVFLIGRFAGESSNNTNLDKNTGKINHVTRWTFKNDDGWCFWIRNAGPAALTTGATVRLLAKHFGVWVV